MAELIDAQGLKCPLPVLRARKVLRAMAPGEELTVLATDEAAPADFRAFCEQAGHALLSISEADGVHTIVIQIKG
ncbi:MAG: sulfurtransferase TusA family protein [Alphaproteobacteria bacterium]